MFSRFESWFAKQRAKCNRIPWSHCARPEKSASTEFSFTDRLNWTSEAGRCSSPRRLLTNFLSERNINNEADLLKHFLKEHDLYNKHQTIQQRRRLRYLLELEKRTPLNGYNECADTSIVLQYPKTKDSNDRTCPVEVHSMPFQHPSTAVYMSSGATISSVSSKKIRRVASLPSLASPKATDPRPENHVTASYPTIAREVQDNDKPKREGKFLDVTLTCDGGVVKAHQIILAAGSPYFEDMFLENRHECPIVHLRHVSVHDMRLILDFVYEGKVYLSLSELPNFIKSAEDLQIRGMLQSNATGAKASDTGHVVEELCETVTSLAVPISESIKNITKHCSPEKSMLQVEPDMVQVKNAPVDTVPISNDGDEHMGRRGRDGDDGKDDECFSSNEGMMRSYQMQEPLPHNSQQHLNFEAVVHKSRRESIAVMPSTPEERTSGHLAQMDTLTGEEEKELLEIIGAIDVSRLAELRDTFFVRYHEPEPEFVQRFVSLRQI
uniref:BTB domain-containing protein n=1 Tax=Anopheles christyi TaxID=43041 RepID=A0A182K071_9DIPT